MLDVGSGSGYLVACLGHMVGEKGKVIGIDRIKELVEWGKQNVKKDSPELLEKGIVEIRVGDGWAGVAEAAPFDAIHVGAAAATLPQSLVDQLRVRRRHLSSRHHALTECTTARRQAHHSCGQGRSGVAADR